MDWIRMVPYIPMDKEPDHFTVGATDNPQSSEECEVWEYEGHTHMV